MANTNSSKVLQVRLQEKIDLDTNWANKEATFVPLKGEKIVYQVDTGVSKVDKNGSTTKVYETISKTGDGVHYLKDLPYDEALAADVPGWAKEETLKYDDLPQTLKDEIDALQANNKALTIKDGNTTVVAYSPNAAKTITLTDGNGVAVTGTSGKIDVKGVTANGTTAGVVKSGGVATITNGEITAISEAGHAGTADDAGQAGKLTTNAGFNNQPVYFANGVPVAIGYTIEKSVPSDAKFTDTNNKVTQTNDTSTNNNFPLLIKNTANTTAETNGVKSASKVTINPSTGKVITSGDIEGKNITASGTVTADGVTAGTMSATTFTGALNGNATTATTAAKTQAALTFGNKTFDGSEAREITAADLGISAPLDFIGTTTTALTDGAKTTTITVNNESHTAVKGDVVLYGDKEFVYTGSEWEELGDASVLADAVSDIQNYEVKAGTGLTGGGKISTSLTISHGENLANAFTGSSNANLTITAGDGEKTINIPKINVNKLGHITSVSNQQVKITIPSAPTLSIEGGDIAADTTVVGGIGVDKHKITVQKKTIGVTNPSSVLEVTGDASNVKIGFKTANRGANDILFGDETWHGHDSYIVLCGGSADENI